MNDSGNWNSEAKRLERKRRLESLKAKDGKKAPVEPTSKTWKILKPVIAVVLVLSLGLWAAVQFSLPQKFFPPMTVGGEKISAEEFAFYYSNTLSQLQIDRNTAEGKEKLKALSTEEGYEDKTWQEFAIDQTAKTIVEFHVQYKKALEEGLTLTEEELKEVDDIFENIISQTGSIVEADKYMAELFGKNVTVKNLKPVFLKSTLASKYATGAIEKISVSDDDIKEYYEENKNSYDNVTFRLEYFPIETKTDATDDEKEEFDEQAKARAEEFLDKATDEDVFKTLSDAKAEEDEKAEYEKLDEEGKAEADEKKEEEEKALQEKLDTMTEDEIAAFESAKDNADYSIIYSMAKSNIDGASAEMGTWLFDDTRTYGDKEAFLSGNGYYAIYFVSRDTETSLPSARHILISPNEEKDARNGDTFTKEEWDAARELAEEVLEMAVSEEKFIELVTEYSTDPGSAETGGLYEGIQRNQMMPEFNDWVFDSSRKAGDQGIVRTDYGFHIMRFVGFKTTDVFEDNKESIKNIIAGEVYRENLEELIEQDQYSYNVSSLGISLIS